MISTHWRKPHKPSERDLTLFDILVRQIADVLERQRSQNELKKLNHRKDEFLAILSHELRNPLFPIKNAIYLLQRDNMTNHQQLLQMMERQLNHVIRLVDDLLEISRITTGKIELHKETINLVQQINDAMAANNDLIDSKRQQIIFSEVTKPLLINADRVRITQVFANLLNNAAKYTQKNGIISISFSCENNEITISIRDNGVGISAQFLPDIFEMFTQEKHDADPNNKGLGIGLAMARNLVELHGGTIKAYSAGHNKGSEFIVTLPFNEEHRNTIEEDKLISPRENLPLLNRRILVVDDNPDILDSLVLLLGSWKLNVHAVSDGRTALAILDEFHPHIILIDIGMPEMDGYKVAESIRTNPQYDSIKLVALTGWNQEKDKVKAKNTGFNVHLAKPVDIDYLKDLLITL